ncbi:hypothetical protein BJY01DRAFT_248179 [Aspergillus pseudoustus]|uniref:Transcription factor domain-containing protein n=1 Tax=Aspergillus pseudoustus TaxID=1810923 RepID=A0ABR4JWE3_9EURO
MAAQEADNVALHLFRSLSRARVPSSVIQGWAQFKAGELVSIDGLCRDRFDQDGLSPSPTFSSARAYADAHQINAAILPDRGLIHKCARLYMKSIIRVTFPILEPSGFNETTRLAYEPAADHPSHVLSARACIVAFCMFAYLVPLGIQVCSERKFIYYSALLQRALPTITEAATVDGFQACIFLLLSQFFTGRMISASVTNSLAAQFVFHLDAHTEGPTRSFSWLQGSDLNGANICLRSLFWVCYTIDKELCLRTRQPPALSDNHCDLTIRTDYLARFLEGFADSLPFGEFHPSMMFPVDIKLSQIKSQAYDSLYSRAAFREGHTKLFTQIRKLDETLERWRMAVPQKCRPSLLFPSDTSIDARDVDIRTLILRLDYLHCMAVIHQASNRGLQTPINGHNTKATIASSIALAVEASRSSLRYLDNAHHILSKGSFW